MNKADETEIMELTTKGKAYPEITAAIKAESASAAIEMQRRLLQRNRIDLWNRDAVAQTVDSYLAECSDIGTVPTFEGLAVAMGYSRKHIYEYLRKHPSSESAQFLQTARTAFFEVMKQEGLKRNYSEAMAIFLLKNSNEGYTDRTEHVSIKEDQPKDALEDAAEVARRYLIDIDESEA